MPGTGKTATVREVIRELKEKYVFDVISYIVYNNNSI